MMTLSPELYRAAQDVGLALRHHEAVQPYLQATTALAADAEASALDEQFETVRADLITRQRAGEDLPVDEVEAFYTLRTAVTANGLVENRDYTLALAKEYLVQVSADLNRALGLDYVTLALS
ncbi:MAG TPA: YlbF family regulator [Chloroflexota bacterium]|nr:YlbF family regulator [Chloroflexota bacterium]